MLKPGGQVDGDEALEFYAKHTAQIEVKAVGAQGEGLQWALRCPGADIQSSV